MNRTSFTLHLIALGCFGLFHFTNYWVSTDGSSPVESYHGWQAWIDLAQELPKLPKAGFDELLIWGGFLTGAVLMIGSPFTGMVFRASRLMWWLGTLSSAAAMIGLGILLIPAMLNFDSKEPGPGFLALHAALLLNFLGFLFIRREIPPNPVIDPA